MTTKIIDNNGVVSLGSISDEKDLKIEARFNINPPPEDGRCECCGRHISELTPFGKAGDPLVGDFDGELLVKKFRPSGPYDEQAEKAWDRVEKLMEKEGRAGEDPLDMMIKIYGKHVGEKHYWSYQLFDQIGKSWECRDCAVLDEDEYFEYLEEIYSNIENKKGE